MEVMRRLCCPCPLAALKSPNVVGVDGYGTKPVGLNDRENSHNVNFKTRHTAFHELRAELIQQ